MELYEEAVELALKVDLELAKQMAHKPAEIAPTDSEGAFEFKHACVRWCAMVCDGVRVCVRACVRM